MGLIIMVNLLFSFNCGIEEIVIVKRLLTIEHKNKMYTSIFKNIAYLYVYAEMHLSQFRRCCK